MTISKAAQREGEELFARAWKLLDAGRPTRAFSLFLTAARLGHDSSQVLVGYLHYLGRGVRRSRKEAFSWYRKAARRGNAAAVSNIGILYKEKGSMGLAKRWLKRAVSMGLTDSLLDLAKIEVDHGSEKVAERYLRKLLKHRDDISEGTEEQARAMLARLEK